MIIGTPVYINFNESPSFTTSNLQCFTFTDYDTSNTLDTIITESQGLLTDCNYTSTTDPNNNGIVIFSTDFLKMQEAIIINFTSQGNYEYAYFVFDNTTITTVLMQCEQRIMFSVNERIFMYCPWEQLPIQFQLPAYSFVVVFDINAVNYNNFSRPLPAMPQILYSNNYTVINNNTLSNICGSYSKSMLLLYQMVGNPLYNYAGDWAFAFLGNNSGICLCVI